MTDSAADGPEEIRLEPAEDIEVLSLKDYDYVHDYVRNRLELLEPQFRGCLRAVEPEDVDEAIEAFMPEARRILKDDEVEPIEVKRMLVLKPDKNESTELWSLRRKFGKLVKELSRQGKVSVNVRQLDLMIQEAILDDPEIPERVMRVAYERRSYFEILASPTRYNKDAVEYIRGIQQKMIDGRSYAAVLPEVMAHIGHVTRNVDKANEWGRKSKVTPLKTETAYRTEKVCE